MMRFTEPDVNRKDNSASPFFTDKTVPLPGNTAPHSTLVSRLTAMDSIKQLQNKWDSSTQQLQNKCALSTKELMNKWAPSTKQLQNGSVCEAVVE